MAQHLRSHKNIILLLLYNGISDLKRAKMQFAPLFAEKMKELDIRVKKIPI